MMKMNKVLILVISCFTALNSVATEGMWIPTLLGSIEDEMQAYGLQLSAEDIYSINHSSLKDAIVHFNGGCTAEMISNEGLLLTNHHCGYGQIQYHSSLENDYLTDGFWAMTRADELMNPDLVATFILSITDVTDQVLKGTDGENGAQIFQDNMKKLEEAAATGRGIQGLVRAFNYGNSYYLIKTKTYEDVRLVGAPPSSIGKFGGDTDNWLWPRHTGDFSIFRIYADSENEPAPYSTDNVPYQPEHSLPINMKGVEEGDFTMVFGFPGRTEQYLTSYAVDYVMNQANPMRIDMRSHSLAVIDEAMNSDKLIKIQYAAKQSRISNSYKKWIGQNKGLKILNAMDVKEGEEKILRESSAENKVMLDRFEELYKNLNDYAFARDLFIEYYFVGPEIYRHALQFSDIVNNYDTLVKTGQLKAQVDQMKKVVSAHFKNYQLEVDKDVFTELTKLYREYSNDDFEPAFFNEKAKCFEKGQFTDWLYKSSLFSSEEKMTDLVENFSAKSIKKIKKDPAYIIANQLYDGYFENVRPKYNEYNSEINSLMQKHVLALEETFPEKVMWPDANSTLRLTYGKAEGSEPVDGMEYKFYTTSRGILDKYDPENPDFVLPPRLIDILKEGDFGKYATEGELRVCFTGSNHTTGGNSGSPALDGNGYLIGLNFDRTWESTMSDIMFDPNRCRNIMVDIKYVLFVVDKYAGAGHLVDEMELVYPE